MPILNKCWTPFIVSTWTSVKYGSYYTAVYSVVLHLAILCYGFYILGCQEPQEFFGSYFEFGKAESQALAIFATLFCTLFLIATMLLVSGIRKENQFLLFPWMILMVAENLMLVILGIWFIATSYSNIYPIAVAFTVWCIDGFHIYCLLCVISQYQVLSEFKEPHFFILSQDV